MKPIDTVLNRFTTYKVVLFSLFLTLAWAIIASLVKLLDISTVGLLATFALAFGGAAISNYGFAKLYKAPSNSESWGITGLILTLILPQATTPTRAIAVLVAAVLAMASKYVINYRYQHVFNPAAFGAAVIGIVGLGYATWWVGSPVMAPLTIVLGLLILRKLRHFELAAYFFAASIITSLIVIASLGEPVGITLRSVIFSSPLLFLGTVMLTEPSTMPVERTYRIDYALIVGVLSSLAVSLFGISLSAQIALLVANLFAFAVSRRPRYALTLKERIKLTPSVYDYVFSSTVPLAFTAGQYMDWTLPHPKEDIRGTRRSFTVASAPNEREVHLGIRVSERSSSFKKALAGLNVGDTITAGQVSGAFTMPEDSSLPLVWIAGGVGITPFRSMAKALKQKQASVDLFYLARNDDEFAYRDVFDQTPTITTHYINGTPLSTDALTSAVPDYAKRTFYIAGPDAMVTAYTALLRDLGITRTQIKTDHFSGY